MTRRVYGRIAGRIGGATLLNRVIEDPEYCMDQAYKYFRLKNQLTLVKAQRAWGELGEQQKLEWVDRMIDALRSRLQ